MKSLSRLENQPQLNAVTGLSDTKPRAESLVSGRSLEDLPSTTQHQDIGISPYLEQ